MPARAKRHIEIHGHRGARAVFPENSLPAFEYAIARQVDVLELDMVVTKDDVVVVCHEPILNAPLHLGPENGRHVRDLTLAELQQWTCGHSEGFPAQQSIPSTKIPTLEQVFSLADQGTFRFNIETKSEAQFPDLTPPPREFVQLVLALIRRHNLESRVIVQSFDYRTLVEMRAQAPGIELSALTEDPAADYVEICRQAGNAEIISPNWESVTADNVKAAHSAGIRVIPWTPNSEPAWRRLIAYGIDGIITDDPGALIAYLDKKL